MSRQEIIDKYFGKAISKTSTLVLKNNYLILKNNICTKYTKKTTILL